MGSPDDWVSLEFLTLTGVRTVLSNSSVIVSSFFTVTLVLVKLVAPDFGRIFPVILLL